MAAPHLLILDEPTNHLDIDSRRALLDALNDYEGAVILVTHDRSLIELVADRLWLTADGGIKPFAGDMDDYARFVLDRAKAGIASPSQPTADLAETAAASEEQGGADAARLAARKASKKRRRRGY
jgi:ATP-binding cassette subfamily F protein 3